MNLTYQSIRLGKRFPLRISRGVHAASDNLFITLEHDGVTGLGEMAPGSTEGAATAEAGASAIQTFITDNDISGLTPAQSWQLAQEQQLPACALAALDIALWDRCAKVQQQPLYQCLGFNKPAVPTSVTIGINPPEVVRERIPLLLDGTGVRSLKIKLGSPDGIDADKAMYEQVIESVAPYDVQLRVDANGGWSVESAIHMMQWISDRGADYIEQPLAEGMEEALPELYKNRPLPIFIDESCRSSDDVGKWAHCIDGVNMKLMKCGGITGALAIVRAAKQHNLKTMIGCMGESSVSIAAGVAVSGALNHIDLDSHLNLAPDPASGAPLVDGVIVPLDVPGHGATLKAEFLNTGQIPC